MIPLATPNLSGNEAKYLQECIETTFVSSVGPFVTRFERMVAEASGAAEAVSTTSGTSALHLGLMTLGVKAGDLVIIPSFTFIASANAVSHCGAIPWMLDVAPDSWTLDAKLLRRELAAETVRRNDSLVHTKTGRRVSAIMPVYTLGSVADIDAIREVATEFGLPVLADAAAALGATYKGRTLGGLTELSAFSFNGNKTITAGAGGALAGNDLSLLQKARHVATTGRVGTDYHHDVVAYNYRMTNLQAAVGCAQLEQLEKFVAAKRRIRARYNRELGGLKGVGLFPEPAYSQGACWFSGVTVDLKSQPTVPELCVSLRKHGVESRPFWKPIHQQPPYADAPRSNVEVCEKVWPTILTLPSSTHLSDEAQGLVIEAVRKVLAG